MADFMKITFSVKWQSICGEKADFDKTVCKDFTTCVLLLTGGYGSVMKHRYEKTKTTCHWKI